MLTNQGASLVMFGQLKYLANKDCKLELYLTVMCIINNSFQTSVVFCAEQIDL